MPGLGAAASEMQPWWRLCHTRHAACWFQEGRAGLGVAWGSGLDSSRRG